MVLPEYLPENVFDIDLTEDVLDVTHGARSSAVSGVKAFAILASAKVELNTSNEESKESGEPTPGKSRQPFKIPPPKSNLDI